jgi:hypothetical protein
MPNSLAQTKTPTPSILPSISPTASADDKDVQALKEKIANKVSEIRKKDNKAFSGDVIDNKDNLITIKTEDGSDYQVRVDDTLTKYYQIAGSQKKEIKIDDIKKGNYIIITGVLTDKIIDANLILIDEQYLILSGKISEVINETYSLKVITADKDTYTLDIETYTKQQIINIKTLEIEQIGFSKIKEGDTIHFVVKAEADNKDNKYSAQKILIIPQEYFIK